MIKMNRPSRALAILAVMVSLGTAGSAVALGSPKRGTATRSADTPARCTSGTCYVAVSVATLWVRPWYPRTIDAPALGNPAQPQKWVRSMTVSQQQWLVGKLETQALYGTRLLVTGHWHSWEHVAVPSQPTNRDRRGYPGWVPAVQLTRTAPQDAATSAVIRTPTAWLWSRWTARGVAGAALMLASFDTRLPLVRATARYVEVTLIGGRKAALRRSDIVLHAAGTGWQATRARVIAEARSFLGLPYLWAGTSGLGYDCSGFTYAVYHTYGITLSRDADQQAAHGAFVLPSALKPGDLVFFRDAPAGPIGHVGMYIGAGNMIDAPHTGAAVRVEPVSSFPNYAGARRYLSH